MLSRLTACCLVALVLSPFTAPFRTCDLAALFGGAQTQHPPAGRPLGRTFASDSNLASVPAISRIGRVRLLEPSGVSMVACDVLRALTVIPGAAGFSHRAHERSAFATILRV
jgi:hypothetical protein